MLIASMSEHKEAKNFNEELKELGDNDGNNQPIL